MTADNKPLRVVIVDDEEPARLALRGALSAMDDVTVVGECAHGFDAVKTVADVHPDVVLLDVNMPKLDGFEVLELIGPDVPVVFVTAYDEFALKAFEVHAVDYLLKPFSEERFAEALTRARGRLQSHEAPADIDGLVAATRPKSGPVERVLIRDGSQVHVIPVEKIDYVEAQDDYVCFKAEGRQYLKDQTMGALETQLDPGRFVRIHRSYFLNIELIARVELYAKDSRVAILRDGTRLPVSRAGYTRLAKLL